MGDTHGVNNFTPGNQVENITCYVRNFIQTLIIVPVFNRAIYRKVPMRIFKKI